jgi:hypothetical protein
MEMTDQNSSETISFLLQAREDARAEMEFALRPQIEHLRMSYDASTKFADHAIRSGFVLNGGGLVLLSGFAALFKVDPTVVVKQIAVTMFAFIVGLVCASVTAFLAYRSVRAGVDIASHRIAGTTLIHLQGNKHVGDRMSEPKVKAQYDAAARLQSRAARDGKLAVIFGFAGLASFVCGVVVGGWTLMATRG